MTSRVATGIGSLWKLNVSHRVTFFKQPLVPCDFRIWIIFRRFDPNEGFEVPRGNRPF
jgi:hypothetical protein